MTASIGAIGGAGAQASTTMESLGGLGPDGFMKLLIAQLRYQNPMEPSDPSDMMMQTSQLAQLDAVQQLASLQQRDIGMQQAVGAAALVGTHVTGTTPEGAPVTGTVNAVRFTTDGPVLDIDGTQIAYGAVSEIRRAPTD